MNNDCLPCEQGHASLIPCADCPPPAIVTPCLNGESCVDIIDAHCIVFTGDDIPNIGAGNSIRLDKILKTLNTNSTSTNVSVEDTMSIDFEGNGLLTNKLKANLKISEDLGNILTVKSDGVFVGDFLFVSDSNDIISFKKSTDGGKTIFTAHIDYVKLAEQICGLCPPTMCIASTSLTINTV